MGIIQLLGWALAGTLRLAVNIVLRVVMGLAMAVATFIRTVLQGC